MAPKRSFALYPEFLQRVKQQIQQAQVKVVSSANQQLLLAYWRVGQLILYYQQQDGWGSGVIDRLATDIRDAHPGIEGFSARNLRYMRKLVQENTPLILQQGVAELPTPEGLDQLMPDKAVTEPPFERLFLDSPLSRITWSHHIILLDKVKEPLERMWYVQQTLTNNWGRNILRFQIDTGLFRRQIGPKVTNFDQTLPKPHSDLAQQLLKDPYVFDFVVATAKAKERNIEDQLVQQVTKFLLELGQGFAFVGQQYPLRVDDSEYYIDLLFYHIRLRCYVVIELKARDFEPGDAGQINFYVNVVNEYLRVEGENPTIGILLCKGKNQALAEYALSGMTNPLGVADYELTKAIPDELKSQLPSIESLEQELAEEDEGVDEADN
ncbi:PDDEXK nuclease domain-containing protein (plasmid) [Fibrella sp. ES10-3-2-2]